MDTSNFSTSPNGACLNLKIAPDQKSINRAFAMAKKAPCKKNLIIIARFQWLRRSKLVFPDQVELPNLCLVIKEGKLIRAFYSNELSHIIKKQNYYIQILN